MKLLKRIQWDDGTYLTWGDICCALFVCLLWGIISLIVSAILFQWIEIPNWLALGLGIPQILFAIYLFYKRFTDGE